MKKALAIAMLFTASLITVAQTTNSPDQTKEKDKVKAKALPAAKPQGRSGSGKNTGKGSANLITEKTTIGPVTIYPIPQDLLKDFQQGKSIRVDELKIGKNTFRTGYYAYYSNWFDSNFCYGFYGYSYIPDQVIFSPWYYYPQLPAYISLNRVIYLDTLPVYRFVDTYDWSRSGYGSRRRGSDRELDYALDDLTDAFELGDQKALGALIPRRGAVNYFMDGIYRYTLNADDAYDLLLDAITWTRTLSFDVLNVQRSPEGARVLAAHHYLDSWNRRAVMYYWFVLSANRRGYDIIAFSTGQRSL